MGIKRRCVWPTQASITKVNTNPENQQDYQCKTAFTETPSKTDLNKTADCCNCHCNP